MPDNDENNIPPSEAWQYDPEYWTDYKYEASCWTKKSDKDEENEETYTIIDDLPESRSVKYI